jgi:hypothetical protein
MGGHGWTHVILWVGMGGHGWAQIVADGYGLGMGEGKCWALVGTHLQFIIWQIVLLWILSSAPKVSFVRECLLDGPLSFTNLLCGI